MNQIEDIISAHPLAANFDIRLVKHRAGRITLRLTRRNLIRDIQLSVLSRILDCAASAAGFATIGKCFIAECEINIHTQLEINQFVVSTRISNSSHQIATFECEIHGINQRAKTLIAESHGTLLKTKVEWPIVA